ncbi:MAG: hypothetical protein JW864_01140 [Spirochaetes bacterium]|nr:hypothetical protein [Spirochaetota bacterium]
MPSPEYPVKDMGLKNAILTADKTGREAFALKDLTYSDSGNTLLNDIILSFNSPSADLRKDDTGKYNIGSSSYRFIKNYGVLGGGGACFLKKDHKVEITPSKNLWLGSCNDLGSFSLEFRFRPIALNDNSTLFSRVGYLSGRKNGIEISLWNGRIIASLYRMFKSSSGMRYDIQLLKGRALKPDNWYHFVLSFDRVSGKLAKYLNGYEEEVIYATETDSPYEGVYEPCFECIDMPAAVIGENFNGYIDEFRISCREIDNLATEQASAFENYKKLKVKGRYPENYSGMVESPVYSFSSTGTSVALLKWDEFLPDNTFIWMEFRISDSLFSRSDMELKWYRIINNQKNIHMMTDSSGNYLRGKYYQWRAYLIASPEGKYSPLLYDVELLYRPDPPPESPLFVEAVSVGDKYIILRWNKNVEHDLLGYRIYYGVQSGVYSGILSHINGKRITNDFNSNRKYIEVRISNDIIEENKEIAVNPVLDYPVFENTVLYFFAISAYDSYKPDTQHNHESLLSREVKARPFAGSEIKF